MAAKYLAGKVAYVIGSGSELHRGVAVALADAGADIAIGGPKTDLPAEAALHSIANEIWAIGRRSTVVTIDGDAPAAYAAALASVIDVLGKADLVIRAEAVVNA